MHSVSNELAEQYPKKCLNNSQSEFRIFAKTRVFSNQLAFQQEVGTCNIDRDELNQYSSDEKF